MAFNFVGTWQQGRLGVVGNPLDYGDAPVAATTTTGEATIESGIDGAMTAESPADGGSFDVADATGFPTPPSSTLAGDVGIADGEVTLADASGFDDSGEVLINAERMTYGSRTGTVLSDITRGVGGTTVAAHSSSDDVQQPRVVVVEQEPIVYHTLVSDTLGGIRREDPEAHDDAALCAPHGLDLDVTSAAGFPAEGGVAELESGERIAYASVSSDTLVSTTRAVSGTAVASNPSGDDISAFGYSPRASSRARQGEGARLVPCPNTSGGALSAGIMVSRNPSAGTGGIQATTEGDGIVGLLSRALAAGAWGPVQAGGAFSALLDAAYPELPGPCEPVFAASSTTVKSLANADSGDVAVGRCLRTHAEDFDGSALATARVDMVMLTEWLDPFTAP